MPSTTTHPTSLPLPPNRAPSSTLSTRSLLSTTATTPSLLTPNTRSEAEAAFSANSLYQTDAAAPPVATPNLLSSNINDSTTASRKGPEGPDEEELEVRRQSLGLGVRPPFPTRSSTNYFNALRVAMKGKSAAPTAAAAGEDTTTTTSNTNITVGKEDKTHADETEEHLEGGPVGGVAGTVSGWQPKMNRQQSWTQQDMHRVMQQKLMEKTAEGDMGYDSAA